MPGVFCVEPSIMQSLPYCFLLLQEDEDGHLVVLEIIQDLTVKAQEVFLDHFARLGIFSKVLQLAGPPEPVPIKKEEPVVIFYFVFFFSSCFTIVHVLKVEEPEQEAMEDGKELLTGKAYHWREWCICRGRDCLYIWSDAAALELSNGSNGWFRFILDGKLATMYSSGSPEGGSEASGEFYGFVGLFVCNLFQFFSSKEKDETRNL